MTITNGYFTLANFKTRAYPEGLTDTLDDPTIERVIESVSRWIDAACGRQFYDVSAATRYYTRLDAHTVLVDDLLSVTTLATDEDGSRAYALTWATTDYDLEPYNAPQWAQPQPYTKVCVAPNGRYRFPTLPKSIKVVGTFGYAVDVPSVIGEACFLQAYRLFRRKDAPFGVTGSAEIGQLLSIPRLDPDVKLLLAPFKRVVTV